MSFTRQCVSDLGTIDPQMPASEHDTQVAPHQLTVNGILQVIWLFAVGPGPA